MRLIFLCEIISFLSYDCGFFNKLVRSIFGLIFGLERDDLWDGRNVHFFFFGFECPSSGQFLKLLLLTLVGFPVVGFHLPDLLGIACNYSCNRHHELGP